MMERINPYGFYELARRLRRPLDFQGDASASELFFPVVQAYGSLKGLLDGDLVPLSISKSRVQTAFEQIDSIYQAAYFTDAEEGKKEFRYPKSDDPPIESWRMSGYRSAIEAFETVFSDEMRESATYRAPSKSIFSTPKLVDSADDAFPSDIASIIPAKTRADWKSAGRCLAFSLYSASGFHVARAVEGMMEAYYTHFTGKGRELNSWNDYIKALQSHADGESTIRPSQKTIGDLDKMRADYRNPLMHPRVVLLESDAIMLFSNGLSILIAMGQEMIATEPSQPSLI